jgi:septal ring factor EnvC (AmiA/AmiB activator)
MHFLDKAINDLKDENKKLNERIKNLEDVDNEILREALLNLKVDYDKVVKEIKEDNANNTL